ncbi:terpene synthase family protein [Streptomyces sp. TRM70308]|uniref:terpene synthase family protein n=1 Tax=Streptomyces sp. TRM70308 TaxID=3131932 RepID=UPI003D019A7E
MPLPLPALFCPIEPRIHPEADAIEAAATAWWTGGGYTEDATLLAHTAATRSGVYLARCLPDCAPDRVETLARWSYVGFAFDDLYCDRGPLAADPAAFLPLAARTVAALDSLDPAAADGVGLVTALQDVTRRYAAHAAPAQLARWTQAHRRWLTGAAEQIAYRSRRHVPGPDAYLVTRLSSVAGEVGWAGIEMSLGPELPERAAPAVRALGELATLVTMTDNEVFSAAAEAQSTAHGGTFDPGLFDALAHARNPPLDHRSALDAGIALRDRALVRFLRLRAQIAPRASRPLTRYLDALTQMVRANLDFSLDMLTARYAAHGVRPPADRAALFTDRPSDDSPAPPPLPSLAWLWSDLSL